MKNDSCKTTNSTPVLPRAFLGLALLPLTTSACVRRTISIDTDPQGAVVYLNDREVGTSPVSTDFTWYGDYRVDIRKPGYQTLNTHLNVLPPWYQLPLVDFFADVLWPGRVHDLHQARFALEKQPDTDLNDLLERAAELKTRALDTAAHKDGS